MARFNDMETTGYYLGCSSYEKDGKKTFTYEVLKGTLSADKFMTDCEVIKVRSEKELMTGAKPMQRCRIYFGLVSVKGTDAVRPWYTDLKLEV